jgi:Fe-S cluster biogenesis protein NfuA
VYVELQGACHTCPSSIVTMQQGIERLLREEFPHFGQLVRVDG